MNDIRNDKNLQEAVSRREQQLEPMPADLNERLMKNLSQTPLDEKEDLSRPRFLAWKRWGVGLSVAIAASILLLWLFNFSQMPSDESPVLTQQTKAEPMTDASISIAEEPQPEVVASEQPELQPVEAQEKAEPQVSEPTPTENVKSPHHYNPQAIPDITSPRGELFLASTSHTVTTRSYNDGLSTNTTSDDSEDDGLSLTAVKEKGWMPDGWTDLKSWSNSQKVFHHLTEKERKQLAVLDAIADKQWHIDITLMNTMRYGSRSVTPDYFLELRGDTLRSYLPYLGQAQVSSSLSPTMGLNFEAPVKQYKESSPKGKYTQIDIDVKTREDSYHYVIDIYDSGEAYIRVRSLNRDPISFDGSLEIK